MRDLSRAKPEVYQTGRTSPPKSYMGMVVIVLILVIFLGGIVSMLALMKIRLFRQIEMRSETDQALSFRSGEQWNGIQEPLREFVQSHALLGIMGQEVTAFYESYYGFPEGFIVTQVDAESDAFLQGLRPGDVIIALNGINISGDQTLSRLLEMGLPEQTVNLTVSRDKEQLEFLVDLRSCE